MIRNITTEAVLLRRYRVGEIHKRVDLFTKEHGIIQAIAHGAYKTRSRLSGMTDPFSLALVYLYLDPVKSNYKITDIVIKDDFDNLRGNLSTFYYASFAAEVVLKSFGGGEQLIELFHLLVTTLQLLDGTKEAGALYILIQFLWRYIRMMGFLPPVDQCGKCGKAIETDQTAYYYRREGVFICRECCKEACRKLEPGAKAYLLHTAERDINTVLNVSLDKRGLQELKNLLLVMTEEIVETPLNSLKTGAEFF
jgi:DNA repair protein RecO (recombination protein O)